ncbi:PP2C family protein-serine/threonine phosphatase [Streptomyces sp. CAU 1734]|uniref:PP2C family protein-serine/threonine phosphatase n=1 Tax=Streptomyces sp. CAU 1734 TaxID=3140360 RepID=UPI00326036CC
MRRILPVGVSVAGGAAALAWRVALPPDHPESLGERIIAGVVLLTVGTGIVLGVRRRLIRELRRVHAVAHAAQSALLRPLPPTLDGLTLATARLSAAPGAFVGGDLYEAAATPYGVRIVIGDARGHGLPAIGAAAAVLGSFREAAHDEPDLGGVLRRLDRAVQRYRHERARDERSAAGPGPLRPPGSGEPEPGEEFVTVLLLEIDPGGRMRALNCGHPWPHRLGRAVRPLARAEPLPPLGLFPLPAVLPLHRCGRLSRGQGLFLHTDGVLDARDAAGRFFDVGAVLTATLRLPPAAVISAVHTELLRHTGGRLTDDAALLVLRNDDRTRVPARRGRTPRRTRRGGGPESSAPRRPGGSDTARCGGGHPAGGPTADAVRPAAECRADQQDRRR